MSWSTTLIIESAVSSMSTDSLVQSVTRHTPPSPAVCWRWERVTRDSWDSGLTSWSGWSRPGSTSPGTTWCKYTLGACTPSVWQQRERLVYPTALPTTSHTFRFPTRGRQSGFSIHFGRTRHLPSLPPPACPPSPHPYIRPRLFDLPSFLFPGRCISSTFLPTWSQCFT